MSSKSEIRNPKSEISYRPALHAFAVGFVLTTFCLIILGGMVTSKGVGLSVPDWPTSYHYNMFLFPPSMWTGGILYEHTHRLLGSLVGFLCIIVAVLMWRTQASRPWLRWFGIATLAMVIIQGVMGGLRVTEMSTTLAVIHGITAQIFLCMTVVIAAATSRWWLTPAPLPTPGAGEGGRYSGRVMAWETGEPLNRPTSLRPTLFASALFLLAVLLIQLILGATVRHTGSGLAIPDFPSSYGHLIPPFDRASIDTAISQIPYDRFTAAYTPLQVGLQFAHRVWAIAVALTILWVASRVGLHGPNDPAIRRPAVALVALLILQVLLGAMVIWSTRNPVIATAHQATGAATLATAFLLAIRLARARVGWVEAASAETHHQPFNDPGTLQSPPRPSLVIAAPSAPPQSQWWVSAAGAASTHPTLAVIGDRNVNQPK